MDVVDLFGRQVRELIAGAALSLGRAEIADRMRAWDGSMVPDAAEATLYWRWYQAFADMVYDESPEYRPAASLHAWITRRKSPWFDDQRTAATETLEDLARRALSEALAARAMVPWRAAHATVMRHPLGRMPVIGRLLAWDVGPLHPGGSNHTVNNSMIFDAHPPYASDYGPSLRHVVDLADVNAAGGFILATGQSGHPVSRHYRDQAERWVRGELWVLPLDPARVRARDTLVLRRGGR
jgi:penicillin amidase